MATHISVIVSTSPGRESNLFYCLKNLSLQTHQAFDIIIVDDGSSGCEQVSWAYEKQSNITYHWRPNDCCPARSRNTGASLAKSELLVFIDSDILLNPGALQYYSLYFKDAKPMIVYGYYGNYKSPLFYAPSYWHPNRLIDWYDSRFHICHESYIYLDSGMLHPPQLHLSCWSGNLALLYRELEKLNGFNESYVGWGEEDTDLAKRALESELPVHFALDTWGEHQWHTYQEKFHILKNPGRHKQLHRRTYNLFYQPQVFCQLDTLKTFPLNHYLPKIRHPERQSIISSYQKIPTARPNWRTVHFE